MSTATGKDRSAVSREERLAAKLRENLRRRKAQARAMQDDDGGSGGADGAAPFAPHPDDPVAARRG